MRIANDGLLVVVSGVVAWACLSGGDARAACPDFLAGQPVGTVASAEVDEASGLAASRMNDDVLWAHNDSGDPARVFAMNTAGAHLGVYNLVGAGATDWEDIAVAPDPVSGDFHLYLGDIGDNDALRSTIDVYRVAEPAVTATQDPVTVDLTGVETYTLEYPDGARDAETLLVDPASGDLYVISKRDAVPRLYRAGYPQSTTGTITMSFEGLVSWGVSSALDWPTAGDISPGGDEILMRSYVAAGLWPWSPGASLAEALSASSCAAPVIGPLTEPQGEAIAFDAAGGYFTVSEGTSQPIYHFARVPEPATLGLAGVGLLGLLARRGPRRSR